MDLTYYGLEKEGTGRKALALRRGFRTDREHSPGSSPTVVEGVENATIYAFRSTTTRDFWVAQDPKHRSRVTMRWLEKTLGTYHGTVSRIAHDGEKEYEHVGDVAYTTDPATGCWIAIGVPGANGYIIRGDQTTLQRLVYSREVRAPGAYHVITNTCGNKRCVNPAHLIETRINGEVQAA